LRRLSSFRGTFTIAAAEFVTEISPSILALLVNRCLIKRVGPTRYEIHELLRQFASGKLSAAGSEIDRVRSRHAEYYLTSVVTWFQALTGPDQYPTLQRMRHDLANIRLAFQYAADVGVSELLRVSSEGLFFYYDMWTQFEEAETVFVNAADAYAKHKERDGDIEAFLEISGGWFASHIGPDRAEARLACGLKLLGDEQPKTRLHAMGHVISTYANDGTELEACALRIRASVEFYRACQDKWAEGLALAAWGAIESYRDEALSESLAYQSLRLHRQVGDAWGEGLVLLSLARMAETQGNLDLALTRYEESQRLSEPIAADIVGVIEAIAGQAWVTGRMGDAQASESLALEALRLSRGTGNRVQIGRALMALARARQMLRDTASAKELLEEAFAMLTHRQWSRLQARCAVSLLELAIDAADTGSADRWFREASMLAPEHEELPSLQQKLEMLRDGRTE
jgi:tetratricopeptide (TPR) repeat protein